MRSYYGSILAVASASIIGMGCNLTKAGMSEVSTARDNGNIVMKCFSHEEIGPTITASISKSANHYFVTLKNTRSSAGNTESIRRKATYNVVSGAKSIEILIHAEKQPVGTEILKTSGIIKGKRLEVEDPSYVAFDSTIKFDAWGENSFELTCTPIESATSSNGSNSSGPRELTADEQELVDAYQRVIKAGPKTIQSQLKANKIQDAKRTARVLYLAWESTSTRSSLYSPKISKAICKDMIFVCRNIVELSTDEIVSLYKGFVLGSMSTEKAAALVESIISNSLLE